MRKEYSLIDILRILGKWKKHILIATIATAIIASAMSLMMPNYYKSSTTFYAMNPELANPVPLRGEENIRHLFGGDEDTDRLFSVANSTEVFMFLIDSFDLYKHYDIDPTSKKGKSRIFQRINKLYQTTKTKYGAIQLSIEDTDPEYARNMVRATRHFIDKSAQNIIKSSQKSLIEGKKQAIKRQKATLESLSDSLNILRKKYNLVDAKSQGEIISELYVSTTAELEESKTKLSYMKKEHMPLDSINKVKANVAGLENKKSSLSERIQLFNEGYLPTAQTQLLQERTSYELSQDIERLSRLENSYSAPYVAIKVIEKEDLPFEKSRPRRSILVLGFTLLAAVIMSMISIFIETTREVNWKDIYAGKE